jgi:signal transduction histidine kinase
MATEFRRVRWGPRQIRTLIRLWVGSILLSWVVLVTGWFDAEQRLTRIGDRVIADVKALSEARDLESQILGFRRNDLLWQSTREAQYRQLASDRLLDAEQIAADVAAYVNTVHEQSLLTQIGRGLEALRQDWRSEPRASPTTAAHSTDGLLAIVDEFQAVNGTQMEESVATAEHLRQAITYWSVGLAVGAAGLLLLGALSLTQRILRPASNVTRAAAAFGRGDFSARAAVLHDDEMGTLARTFNNMARDIADREKDRLEFVAMVVHDLKNPVLAIEMAARMLDRAGIAEDQRHSYLTGIRDEVGRLRGIICDLTDDVQIVNGRFSVHRAAVDLGALVRHFAEAQSKAFASHQILVQAQEGCIVEGDANRLERVLTNLVSNAVKYSPPGSRVSLQVERNPTRVLLSVHDEGPGIAPEDLAVLFQPFGRGRSAGGLTEGTGMGLYIVKQIVEAHGGEIHVESEPGHGATFRITLPLVRAGAAAP